MFFFMKKIDVNFKKPPQQQLNSLLELYQTGKYPDAEKLSLSITQEFPEYQFAWKVLGATLKQMGKINESLVASQKSVQLEPQDSEAHNNLGVTLKELDRLSEAEASYRKAIRLKPDYAEAQSNLGFILQKLGRLDEAEARYKKAIVLKPDNTKVHFGLGVLYKKQGKFEKAAERFRKVLVDDSNNYQARYHLGSTLENEAKLHYSQAFEGADTKYKLDVVDQNLKYFVKKDIQIDEKIINLLNKLSQSINKLYGFSFAESSRIAVQSINLGPCGPFANEFYKQWNSRFINEVKIAFIMHQLPFECRHVLIKLPNSRLFDGGIGVHDFNIYKGNSAELVVMEKYDLKVLDKYAWGLIRTYPHIHHDFSISKISVLIAKYLDNIYKT
jgi:tetratricopeptide (TPR) repeat protein